MPHSDEPYNILKEPFNKCIPLEYFLQKRLLLKVFQMMLKRTVKRMCIIEKKITRTNKI